MLIYNLLNIIFFHKVFQVWFDLKDNIDNKLTARLLYGVTDGVLVTTVSIANHFESLEKDTD